MEKTLTPEEIREAYRLSLVLIEFFAIQKIPKKVVTLTLKTLLESFPEDWEEKLPKDEVN